MATQSRSIQNSWMTRKSFVAIGGLWSSGGYPRITFDGTVRGDDMTLTLTWGYVGSGTTGRQLKMEGKKIRIER